MFKPASASAFVELEKRRHARNDLLSFGIQYLDDALIGISRSDLVLLGAPSGIGKTQLCCNIALANLSAGRRVHFMALEAEEHEIERRLKYQIIANMYFSDSERPRLSHHLTYDRWVLGDFLDDLHEYEQRAADFFAKAYEQLNLYYRGDRFGITELVEEMLIVSGKSDLFIIDHAHYFDFEEGDENRALKDIAKTVRALVLEEKTPVVLVAHLRKKDRGNEELAPGMDEFMGSSDLVKIATKVVTIAPGGRTPDGCFETFFRTPKNRTSGASNRFIGRVMFDPKRNAYEKSYKVGTSSLTKRTGFEELDPSLQPEWAKGSGENHMRGGQHTNAEGQSRATSDSERQISF